MNILGMGPLEILLIALVAFIFLGPERMSDAARSYLARRSGRAETSPPRSPGSSSRTTISRSSNVAGRPAS